MKEYAVYKGDDLLCIGTVKECANYMGILPESVRFYLTPSYQKRIKKRKRARNYITVINLDDESEEF